MVPAAKLDPKSWLEDKMAATERQTVTTGQPLSARDNLVSRRQTNDGDEDGAGHRAPFSEAARAQSYDGNLKETQQLGKAKYIAQGNELTVLNLTKLDANDEYKCMAINLVGEGASLRLKLIVNCKFANERKAINNLEQTI